MSDIRYRKANHNDESAIIEFQLEMASETENLELDRAVCTKGVDAVFTDPSLGSYFVADSDGEIIASLLITYEWSDWRNGVVWWIQSVYVRPAFRKQGVYAGLYGHVRDLAEANALVRGIRLYVDRRNAAAQAVYTRLGMNGEHYRVFEWMK